MLQLCLGLCARSLRFRVTECRAIDGGTLPAPTKYLVIMSHMCHVPQIFLYRSVSLSELLPLSLSLSLFSLLSLSLAVLDVLLDEKRICFRMDVLHCNLESVEGAGLWDLDFRGEVPREILQNNAIGGGKKCQDVLYEVLLALVQLLPVPQVRGCVTSCA